MEHADGTPRPGSRRLPTPSAPLSAARARAWELGNVRLLTHHGHGHTALFDTSGRVQAHESRCLVDGTLPPPGATCERDTPPFGPPGGVTIGGTVRQAPPPERHGGPAPGSSGAGPPCGPVPVHPAVAAPVGSGGSRDTAGSQP
ncbi:alpha/beta hydrolase [Streptomyces sp. NPDC057239]|uniref:alpha/beta hydrolase n=1 Tax=Streptomyces sp. NPDC057239 TaxID=3346061 RepID=UPI00363D8FE4